MNKHVSILLTVAVAAIFLTALSSNAVSYTLKIHGNANMDESINDEDLTYLEKLIKGEVEKTEFSDANNDDVVDEKDIEQIKKEGFDLAPISRALNSCVNIFTFYGRF